MSSREYFNYCDKWDKNDLKARIYETLINSYQKYLEDTGPKVQYSSESSGLYSEDFDKLVGEENFDMEWINKLLEGKKN